MAGGVGYLLLGQPELAELLMRSLELKGDLPQLLSSEFAVGINVADLTGPEYNYLRRKVRYHAGVNIAAPGAGVFAQAALYPFANAPRVVAQCEQVLIGNPTAGTILVLVQVAVPAFSVVYPAASAAAVLDDRAARLNTGNSGAPIYNFGSQNNAAAIMNPAAALPFALQAGESKLIQLDAILTARQADPAGARPEVGVLIQAAAANTALQCGAIWSERIPLQSELL